MLPVEFIDRMQRLLVEEFPAFLASYERPRNTALRRNPLKGASTAIPFHGESVPWEPAGIYLQEESRPGLHPFHDVGIYYLQEPSAMAPVGLLQPQPGERILDLCAAPGGKTTQIAAAMKGQGILVCNEIHPKRARILSSNIERLGVTNALVLNEHPARLEKRFTGWFDRILVDAPCSGEGMFRKEDAAVSDWSPETVKMCASRQKEILASAAQMLAPGGRLVYSTCTFSPEENEGVISDFLRSHPDFYIEKVPAPYFTAGRPDWIDNPAEGLEHTFRLWPHKLRGEGHFAAVLRRVASGERQELPLQKTSELPAPVKEFLKETTLRGNGLPFGQTWFLIPEGMPDLHSLKVLRAGLELGELRKGRFIPAHALALALEDYPRCLELSAEDNAVTSYLKGETLRGADKGWVLLKIDGCSLGWLRGSDGILKNHYPKGLRRLG